MIHLLDLVEALPFKGVALSLALGQPAYRPRSSTNDLKTIVEENPEMLRRVWDDRFRKKYGPLSQGH